MLRFVFVAALLCFNVALAQDFDTLRADCRAKHADRLNECIVRALALVKPSFVKGIPEQGIPSLDPMLLGDFNLTQTEGRVTMDARYKNIIVNGARNFDIKYLDINYEDNTIRFGVTVPALSLRGLYKMDGQVFDLPLVGEGNFRAVLAGIVIQGVGHVVERGGRRLIGRTDLEFKIKDVKSKVDNLFDGNAVLADTIDHFLRENGDLVLEEIRPMLTRNLNNFMEKLMNMVLSTTERDTLSYIPNANSRDKHRQTTLRMQAAKRTQRRN